MLSKVYAVMGTIIAVVLVTGALWGWGSAGQLAGRSDNPQLALWAIRSAAAGALAGAQVLGLTFLVDAIRGQNRKDGDDRSGDVLRLLAGAVCTACLVGALVAGSLGLAIASK
jgi:hypothetical protein